MTVSTATADSVANIFRADARRMLLRRFTKSNLPAAIEWRRGSSPQSVFELSRTGSTRASATDATHPCFNLRAYGRLRFDANREGLMKRDDRVATTLERRRCAASAKSRSSQCLRADFRSN